MKRRPAVAALLAVCGLSLFGLVAFLAILWQSAEDRATTVQDLATAKQQLNLIQGRVVDAETEVHAQKKAAKAKRQEALKLDNDLHALRGQIATAVEKARRFGYARDMRDLQAAWEADNIARGATSWRRCGPFPARAT